MIEEHVLVRRSVVGEDTEAGPQKKLRRRLLEKAYKQCIPLYTTIEVTLKCNLRCLHCYNFDRSGAYPKQLNKAELRPEEMLQIIDQLHQAGTLFLSLSGGEAMVHPNLLEYVRRARKHHMIVTLKTNGTLVQPERAQELADAGVSAADISLYGATAQTHDTFTLVKGSFQGTIDAIKMLQEVDIKVRISYCLTKENAEETDQMLALCDELGVGLQLDPQITKRYDGTSSSLDHRVSRETLTKLYQDPLREMLPLPDHNPDRSVQCSCARAVCGISSTGDVYPCIGAPIPSGNLREASFEDIWKKSPELNKIRGLSLDDFSACKVCPDRAYCSRSSGAVFNNTDNYTGAESWTCMQASVVREILEEKAE